MQGQTPNTAGSAASATATASEAAGSSHGRLLAKCVVSHGKLLIIASSEAVHGIGALHGGETGSVALVDDGAAALAGVPLLGEPAHAGQGSRRCSLAAWRVLVLQYGSLRSAVSVIVFLSLLLLPPLPLSRVTLGLAVWEGGASVQVGIGSLLWERRRHQTIHGGGGAIKAAGPEEQANLESLVDGRRETGRPQTLQGLETDALVRQ